MSKKKTIGTVLTSAGTHFRVWAPFAKQVFVSGTFNEWGRAPLTAESGGYWSGNIETAEAGHEYKYLIDTGKEILERNDPRALQITSSAGNAVIVDQDFPWEDTEYRAPERAQQVLYEMNIGTFNRSDPATVGTFTEAMEKLDHLAHLGINMIEVMPVHAMSAKQRWWGYTPEYLYAVESLYGGRYQFKEFINAAHKRGIGVILDVVYNHASPYEPVALWRFDGWHEGDRGGIYFYNDDRCRTPFGDTRYDYGRPEVRQFITDNVAMWLHEFHIDGLRVDSTIYMRNVEGRDGDSQYDLPDGWRLLQEITTIAGKVKPEAVLIAEDMAYNEVITRPKNEGGTGFDAQWELNFPHALHRILNPTNDSERHFAELCEQLERRYNGQPLQRVIFTDSHDTATSSGHARLNEEISPRNPRDLYARRRLLIGSAITLTAPGIPMLLQGQEFVEGSHFNDWTELDWEKAEHFAGIIEAHSHLIALRKNNHGNTAGLTGPHIAIIHLNEETKMLAYHRWLNGGARDDVVVVINFSNTVLKDYQLGFPRDGLWIVRFNSDWKGYSADFKDTPSADITVKDGAGICTIAPYSVLIYSQDSSD